MPPNTLTPGDEIDALTPGELMLAIHQSPTKSVIVITKPEAAVELASDARLHTELINKQGKVMALRVTEIK